jgi:ABC-type transport system involved in multi-copper enzyme maturation permease subunit
MLKKEVKEVIKQLLVFLVIAAVMPIPVLLVSSLFGSTLSYGELFFFLFHVGLWIFSVFMGTSLFSRDMGDGGMEYLLTLPYSRLQLLAIKLVPRFLAVLAAFVLYVLLIFITGMNPETAQALPLLSTGNIFFLCISLFIIGIPFSISRGGIVISGLATLFAFMVYLLIIHLFYPTAMVLKGYEIYYLHSLFQSLGNLPGYLWFSAVTLILGSLMAFIFAFKRFNLGPARGVIKRYLKVFIPIFIVIVVVSTVWAVMELWTPWRHYYLTGSDQLVESSDLTTKIYDRTGVTEIDMGDFYWTYLGAEKDHYMYSIHRSRYDSKVLRLDLRDPDYKLEEVYLVRGNAGIYPRGFCMYKDTLAFFERRWEHSRRVYFLVVLHPDTGTFKKTQLHGPTRVDSYPDVIGVAEMEGKRFWLVCFNTSRGGEVVRIGEDGHKEKLSATNIKPVYINGMLIAGDKKTITINKVTPEGLQLIKTHPGQRRLRLLLSRSNLEHCPVKELYFYAWTRDHDYSKPYLMEKFLRLDLETLEMEEITPPGGNRQGFFHYSHPDTWYYTSIDPNSTYERLILKKLYRLKEGKTELIKEFEPHVFSRPKDYYGIFNTGMVLRINGKTRVYRLPGLEEIEFKKLE